MKKPVKSESVKRKLANQFSRISNVHLSTKQLQGDNSEAQAFAIGERHYVGRIEGVHQARVKGWLGCKESTEPQWVKITKGSECQVVLANLPRFDVKASGQLTNEFCGFTAQFAADNDAQAIAEVMVSASSLPVAVPSYEGRKLFFIHIPKTAGSSVNANVQQQLAGYPTYTHVEGMKNEWKGLKQAKFISGHVRYEDYQENFSQHNFITLAFLREPYQHLVSHLNWVRHLSEPEKAKFLAGHSEVVKQISASLAKLDFSDSNTWPSFVENLKPREFGLFDNPQVRYLADIKPGERVKPKHLEQALTRLRQINLLGLAEEFDTSMATIFKAMRFAGDPAELKTENVNRFDYGCDFSRAEAKESITSLVKYDIKLYQLASKLFKQQQELYK